MFDIFGWLRRKAHDAVLGGIADAVQEVAGAESPAADLDGLRRLLATADVKSLPAAAEEDGGGEGEEGKPVKAGGRGRGR